MVTNIETLLKLPKWGFIAIIETKNCKLKNYYKYKLKFYSRNKYLKDKNVTLHVFKGPFTQAIFVAATRCNFCRALGCNFKIARVNQVRFVAAISQGFRTCLKLDAILARQKLHRVAATKIAFVNGP